MSSALTTAALAVTGCQAYYPLEEPSGTTAADAGPFTLSVLTGGTSHLTAGGPARVSGAAGSWTCDGTSGASLTRTVNGGDKMLPSGAFTLLGWVWPTAAWTGTAQILGTTNFFIRASNTTSNANQGAWNSSWAQYQAGDTVSYGGNTWVALYGGVANVNVTPGTNGTVWEQAINPFTTYGVFTTAGAWPQSALNPIPVSKPSMLALTWDGYNLVAYLNGVCEIETFIQSGAGAWDTITTTTGAFSVFGTGAASLTGNMWGVGIWNVAMDVGSMRTIYRAGIGAGNEVSSAPFLNTVCDSVTPGISSTGAVAYYCAGCAGGMRAAEGYVTFNGLKYHHGCYTGNRVGIAPAAVSNSTVAMNDLSDRVARHMFSSLNRVVRREHVEKPFYHDGTYMQPLASPTFTADYNDDWKSWSGAVGGSAAILARYARASRESWLVTVAAQTMEFLISCQVGIPAAWLAPGRTSIAESTTSSNPSTAGALAYGCIQPAYDQDFGSGHSWAMRTMCLIYLALRNRMAAATLTRWEQSIVAGAIYLRSGAYPLTPTNPVPPNTGPNSTNQFYYINGNYMLRYATIFQMVATITGDASWQTQYQTALNWALYPYGIPLHWQGYWAAINSYATSNIAGPDAVYVAADGKSYKCILAISGSGGNPTPSADPTHWTAIDIGNQGNRQGYGLIIDRQGSDATYWSDYAIHLNEYGPGTGGGPPGSPLAGQPGYDGNYNAIDIDEASLCYLINADPVMRQLANGFMNTMGLYPSGGGLGNPQATWFSFGGVFVAPGVVGGSNPMWNIDMTSGQSGGWSTRHNLTDGARSPWIAISQLLGYRTDLTTGFGVAAYVTSAEYQQQLALQWARYNQGLVGYLESQQAQYLMASPNWPGF